MEPIELISKILLGLLSIYVLYELIRSIRLVPQQEAHIVERLGRYHTTLEAGFHALVPFIDRVVYKQDLREETIEVAQQTCFTEDNVRVKVDGVIYISVIDPVNASYGVTDYRKASIQLAQTTTRSVIGRMEMDTTFQERALISSTVVGVLDEVDDNWGIKVHRYEIKNIEPPRTVQKAMERQMSAERERRALVARSEGQQGSTVNDAKGKKKEMINRSEGEKQRRINEAEGKAKEIEALANATAEAISRVARAASKPQGKEALQLRLAEQYLSKISRLGKDRNQVILPADLTHFDSLLEGVSLEEVSLRLDGNTASNQPSDQDVDDGSV